MLGKPLSWPISEVLLRADDAVQVAGPLARRLRLVRPARVRQPRGLAPPQQVAPDLRPRREVGHELAQDREAVEHGRLRPHRGVQRLPRVEVRERQLIPDPARSDVSAQARAGHVQRLTSTCRRAAT